MLGTIPIKYINIIIIDVIYCGILSGRVLKVKCGKGGG